MSTKRKKNDTRQKVLFVIAIILLVVLISGITILTSIVKKYSPSKETSDYAAFYGLETEEEIILCLDNEILEEKGLYLDGEVYVSYDVMHTALNSRFYWDATEQILRYTLPEGIVNAEAGTAVYTVAKEEATADYTIVRVVDDEMYVSLSFLAQYTDIRYTVSTEPMRVAISTEFTVEYITMKKDTQLRELGGIKSSILAELQKGALVVVLEEGDSWAKVCTESGMIGYVKRSALGDSLVMYYTSTYEEPEFTRISKGYTINMAWHQVTNQTANSTVETVLAKTNGVNVISPTWFYLNDNEGGIVSLACAESEPR